MLAVDQWLAPEVLFTAGLGFDILGAILLASGLILGPTAILNLSRTYERFNRHVAVGRAMDKVKAEVGIGLVVAGFTLQALGYLVSLGIANPDVKDSFHVLGGLLVLVGGVLVGYVLYLVCRGPLLRREVFGLARIDDEGFVTDEPDLDRLLLMGDDLWPARAGETPTNYASRVFRRELSRGRTSGRSRASGR